MSQIRRAIMASKKPDYIQFEDPIVAQICAENWGDGKGITYKQAAEVTSFGNAFRGNTDIVKFNELIYFKSVVLGHQHLTDMWGFQDCTGLKEIDLFNAKYVYQGSLTNTQVEEVYAPNVIGGSLSNNTSIKKILCFPSIAGLQYGGNKDLVVLRKKGSQFINTTPSTIVFEIYDGVNTNINFPPTKTCTIYVPDVLVDGEHLIDLYKSSSLWKGYAKLYVIGGPEWVAQFGAKDPRAYLIGTIAERNGHVVVSGEGEDRVVTDTGV